MDLKPQYEGLKKDIDNAIKQVIDKHIFILVYFFIDGFKIYKIE